MDVIWWRLAVTVTTVIVLAAGRDGASRSRVLLSCDFEAETLCSFTQSKDDDVDWKMDKGETSTSNTGPNYDHTLDDDKGTYLYLEASNTNTHRVKDGSAAVLTSPPLTLDPGCWAQLQFFYSMHGEDVGQLEVKIHGETSDAWHKQGEQHEDGHSWSMATVMYVPTLTVTFPQRVTGDTPQFEIIAVRGNGRKGDIAIDDITVTEVCSDATSAQDPCDDIDCLHGECVPTRDGDAEYMCGPCEEHWAGEACDIHCLYGRLVPAKDGGFMCGACDEGWVGEACDIYCLHGKLVPARYVGYGYMCGACEEGWTGEACHERKYTGQCPLDEDICSTIVDQCHCDAFIDCLDHDFKHENTRLTCVAVDTSIDSCRLKERDVPRVFRELCEMDVLNQCDDFPDEYKTRTVHFCEFLQSRSTLDATLQPTQTSTPNRTSQSVRPPPTTLKPTESDMTPQTVKPTDSDIAHPSIKPTNSNMAPPNIKPTDSDLAPTTKKTPTTRASPETTTSANAVGSGTAANQISPQDDNSNHDNSNHANSPESGSSAVLVGGVLGSLLAAAIVVLGLVYAWGRGLLPTWSSPSERKNTQGGGGVHHDNLAYFMSDDEGDLASRSSKQAPDSKSDDNNSYLPDYEENVYSTIGEHQHATSQQGTACAQTFTTFCQDNQEGANAYTSNLLDTSAPGSTYSNVDHDNYLAVHVSSAPHATFVKYDNRPPGDQPSGHPGAVPGGDYYHLDHAPSVPGSGGFNGASGHQPAVETGDHYYHLNQAPTTPDLVGYNTASGEFNSGNGPSYPTGTEGDAYSFAQEGVYSMAQEDGTTDYIV